MTWEYRPIGLAWLLGVAQSQDPTAAFDAPNGAVADQPWLAANLPLQPDAHTGLLRPVSLRWRTRFWAILQPQASFLGFRDASGCPGFAR